MSFEIIKKKHFVFINNTYIFWTTSHWPFAAAFAMSLSFVGKAEIMRKEQNLKRRMLHMFLKKKQYFSRVNYPQFWIILSVDLCARSRQKSKFSKEENRWYAHNFHNQFRLLFYLLVILTLTRSLTARQEIYTTCSKPSTVKFSSSTECIEIKVKTYKYLLISVIVAATI